jgi:CTP:phosphocholine cytidylyltransferase-like protein
MSKKKPDQVVDNPGLMPYTTNVGAPAIQKEDVELWKQRSVGKVNHEFKAKFEELKKQYEQLVDEYNWNELIYNSKYSFEPVIGEIYHLYVGKNDKYFLSLISPTEWDKPHIGSFRINTEHKWEKQYDQ